MALLVNKSYLTTIENIGLSVRSFVTKIYDAHLPIHTFSNVLVVSVAHVPHFLVSCTNVKAILVTSACMHKIAKYYSTRKNIIRFLKNLVILVLCFRFLVNDFFTTIIHKSPILTGFTWTVPT